MRKRDSAGYGLYHPLDATEDPRPNIEVGHWLPYGGVLDVEHRSRPRPTEDDDD